MRCPRSPKPLLAALSAPAIAAPAIAAPAIAALAIAALAIAALMPTAASAQPAGLSAPTITVQGDQLLRNSVPWTPRGVQIVGLVAPDAALSGKYIPAHAAFGAAELQAAVADHADLVRFQVSEFGLDPQGPLYSPAYVQEVQSGVELARSLGLAVIVSLQAEPPAGEPNRCPLPDAGAERAWSVLASMFGSDDGVMFELYNEPAVAATEIDWSLWRNGGVVIYPGGFCNAVGMQTLIDSIRPLAPQNVIVVPGLGGEQTLAGMPALTDPADPADPQLAYGIHYPSMTKGSTTWDRAFGDTSARVPIIVTEWDANSTTNCLAQAPAESALLLDYLQSKRIGLVGFAFDLPGTIVADYSYTPTSYAGFTCGTPNGGPGQLLFGNYAAEAQAGDGTQPDPGPAWIVSAGLLTRLDAADPSLASHFFDTPRTFVTGASPATLAAQGAGTAIPAKSFADETALATTVNDSALAPGTQAVVYAPGRTRATPPSEQRNPGAYFKLAAQTAHAHGLLLVAAPGLGLAPAIAPGTPQADAAAEFLGLGLTAGAARYADTVEIPALTGSTPASDAAQFVTSAAIQAAKAHPGVEILAALNTATQKPRATATALSDTLLRTRLVVSGYGLVDPATPQSTDAGLAFLRRIDRLDG
jgi:hypothetical protein